MLITFFLVFYAVAIDTVAVVSSHRVLGQSNDFIESISVSLLEVIWFHWNRIDEVLNWNLKKSQNFIDFKIRGVKMTVWRKKVALKIENLYLFSVLTRTWASIFAILSLGFPSCWAAASPRASEKTFIFLFYLKKCRWITLTLLCVRVIGFCDALVSFRALFIPRDTDKKTRATAPQETIFWAGDLFMQIITVPLFGELRLWLFPAR